MSLPWGNERLEGRNGDIWRKYCAGTSQEALAAEYGIGQQRISQIIAAVRANIPETDLEEARTKHLEIMASMSRLAADIVNGPTAPLYSNGRPVIDAEGKQVEDHSQRLAAMDRVAKMQERMAKVLGLDAPLKADVTVTEAESEAARAAAVEAALNLHGGTDGNE